jgi:hypothetical protein
MAGRWPILRRGGPDAGDGDGGDGHDGGGQPESPFVAARGQLHDPATDEGAEEAAEAACSGHGSHGFTLILDRTAARGEGIEGGRGEAVARGEQAHDSKERRQGDAPWQERQTQRHGHGSREREPSLIAVAGNSPDEAALDEDRDHADEAKEQTDAALAVAKRPPRPDYKGRRHDRKRHDDEEIGDEDGGEMRVAHAAHGFPDGRMGAWSAAAFRRQCLREARHAEDGIGQTHGGRNVERQGGTEPG